MTVLHSGLEFSTVVYPTWIKSVQASSVEFSVDMTASLYVRTPMNSKPTKEATSVKTPRACLSQRLLERIELERIERQRESQSAPLLSEELCALSEFTVVDKVPGRSFGKSVLVRGSGSKSSGVGGLRLVGSDGSTSLIPGEEDSDGVVALLSRDCGRDDSKEVEEELVLSDGLRSPGDVSGLDEAAGSIMTGFALWFSAAIAMLFEDEHTRLISRAELLSGNSWLNVIELFVALC